MPRRTFIIAALLLATSLAAEARQSTLGMSCGQANALVHSRGAAVLSTGRHTYDRFVAAPGFCEPGEYAEQAYAPTRDGRCRLGYVCQPEPPPWLEDLFFR